MSHTPLLMFRCDAVDEYGDFCNEVVMSPNRPSGWVGYTGVLGSIGVFDICPECHKAGYKPRSVER